MLRGGATFLGLVLTIGFTIGFTRGTLAFTAGLVFGEVLDGFFLLWGVFFNGLPPILWASNFNLNPLLTTTLEEDLDPLSVLLAELGVLFLKNFLPLGDFFSDAWPMPFQGDSGEPASSAGTGEPASSAGTGELVLFFSEFRRSSFTTGEASLLVAFLSTRGELFVFLLALRRFTHGEDFAVDFRGVDLVGVAFSGDDLAGVPLMEEDFAGVACKGVHIPLSLIGVSGMMSDSSPDSKRTPMTASRGLGGDPLDSFTGLSKFVVANTCDSFLRGLFRAETFRGLPGLALDDFLLGLFLKDQRGLLESLAPRTPNDFLRGLFLIDFRGLLLSEAPSASEGFLRGLFVSDLRGLPLATDDFLRGLFLKTSFRGLLVSLA